LKILLDACISPQAKAELQAAGHDVVWAGDWTEDPGDPAILAQANQEGRVLVTLDKDFGELGVLREARHRGIVRIVNFRASQQGRVCAEIMARHAVELQQGAIITAEPGRIRIRQLRG
jgi:predicted nuclease of predicted toxin-antitoxin system